jgi:hypothetical protein
VWDQFSSRPWAARSSQVAPVVRVFSTRVRWAIIDGNPSDDPAGFVGVVVFELVKVATYVLAFVVGMQKSTLKRAS